MQPIKHQQHKIDVFIYCTNFQKSSTMKLEESNVSLKSTASELDVVAVKGELAAESESGLANSSSLADWLLAKSA